MFYLLEISISPDWNPDESCFLADIVLGALKADRGPPDVKYVPTDNIRLTVDQVKVEAVLRH